MLIFILLGVLLSIVSSRIKLSYTVTLLLFGMFLTFLKLRIGLFPAVSSLTHILSAQLFFNIILPPIIFKAVLDMDYNRFIDNLWPIIFLATLGVVISVLLISLLMHFILSMPWFYSLLFATIISPTDPVGVLATLKGIKGAEDTTSLIEGEALLNDATAITLFSILLSYSGGFSIERVGLTVFLVFVVSPLIGFALGYLSTRLLPLMSSAESKISYLFALSYLSFSFTQAIGGSGIIAEIIFAFMISVKLKSEKAQVQNFWAVLDYIANSLLFISMGLVFNPFLLAKYYFEIVVSFLIVFLSRIAIIRSLRIFRGSYDYGLAFLSGIRGAIPLVLALNLPLFVSSGINYTDLIFAITVGIASISLIFQTFLVQLRARRLSEDYY